MIAYIKGTPFLIIGIGLLFLVSCKKEKELTTFEKQYKAVKELKEIFKDDLTYSFNLNDSVLIELEIKTIKDFNIQDLKLEGLNTIEELILEGPFKSEEDTINIEFSKLEKIVIIDNPYHLKIDVSRSKKLKTAIITNSQLHLIGSDFKLDYLGLYNKAKIFVGDQNLTNLKSLVLNNMNSYDWGMFSVAKKIEQLFIEDSNFDFDLLKNFENLVKLSVIGGRVHELPESIEKLKDLDVLIIENCGLHSLNQSILKLKHLRILHMRGNGVIENIGLVGEFKELLLACADYIPGNIEALEKAKEKSPKLGVTPEDCEEI